MRWFKPRDAGKPEGPPEDDGWPSADDISYRIGAANRPEPEIPVQPEPAIGSEPVEAKDDVAAMADAPTSLDAEPVEAPAAAAAPEPAPTAVAAPAPGSPSAPRSLPRRPGPAHAQRVVPTSVRRRALARDAAAILFFGLGVVLLGQVALSNPSASGEPSDDPLATEIAVGGSVASVRPRTPAPTIGPVVDPSLGIDATSTPVPVITLPPPTPTPRVTPRPTPRPTGTPPATSTPEPSVEPIVVSVLCSPLSGPAPLLVSCSASAVSGTVDAWSWTFGDGGEASGAGVEHVFALAGLYTVEVTGTGPWGENKDQALISVDAPPEPSPS